MTFPLPIADYGKDMIWYAAYGSNLSEDRFLCYIKGGKPEGASIEQRGMTDKSLPLINTHYTISHELYFADHSASWNGGVAFVSPEPSEKQSLCRIYLIKRQQFKELLSQENRILDRTVEVDFDQLDVKKRFTASADTWYGLVLKVGEFAGYPVYTFTREDDCRSKRTSPSEPYLNTIIRGFVECHAQLEDDELVSYLENATQKTHRKESIQASLEACRRAYIQENKIDDSLFLSVRPTDDRKDTAREFIVQLNDRNQQNLRAKVGDALIATSDHRGTKGDVRQFKAAARLNIVDTAPADHIVRMDQKIRVAIGVRKGNWVHLRKASSVGGLRLAMFWEKQIGTQPELMRVHRATFEDMEVPIARIPSSTFEVIGTDPGHFVSIQSTHKVARVRAIPLSIEAWNQRVKLIKGENKRYPNPSKVLGLDKLGGGTIGNDIPPIFMDNDLRNELEVNPCDSVRVVRDVKDSFFSKLHFAALPLNFTLIGFAISLDIDTIAKVGIISVGMLISLLALYIQVKTKVK